MHSMTGFGRGSATCEEGTATVEISCVNRKQAEIVVVGARELTELEPRIRKAVLAPISRGRVQISIKFEPRSAAAAPVTVDSSRVAGILAAFEAISSQAGRTIVPEAADFFRVPGLLDLGEPSLDANTAWTAIEPALDAALEQVIAMRRAEGADLAKDLESRLETLERLAASIAETAPGRPERYREMLLKRLRDAKLELDPTDERVIREVAIFADRCDISEEITRLGSHFRKFREYMAGEEPAGRPLDFLCQEIHREFNTIGSKATDAGIAQRVVEAKTELEKIREQVQNVE